MPELYVATLINQITVAGRVSAYEESTVLITADSSEEARERALAFAAAAETTYLNEYGEQVSWALVEVAGIANAVDDDLSPERLATGVEIGSTTFVDLDAYRLARGTPDAARWTNEHAGP